MVSRKSSDALLDTLLNDLEKRIDDSGKKLNNGFYTTVAEQIVGFCSDIEKIRNSIKTNDYVSKISLLEGKIDILFKKTLSYLGGFSSCYQVLKNSCCEYKNSQSINQENILLYLIVEYGFLEQIGLLNKIKKEDIDFCKDKKEKFKEMLLEMLLKTISEKERNNPFLCEHYGKIESALNILGLKFEEQSENIIYNKTYSPVINFIKEELLEKIKKEIIKQDKK